MSDFLFFVAMNEKYPNTAHAACVANDKQIVKQFFRTHAGTEIRKVNGDEMGRLLRDYIAAARP